jgi:hypothetical protein
MLNYRLRIHWRTTLVLDATLTATMARDILTGFAFNFAGPTRQAYEDSLPELGVILALPQGVILEGGAEDETGSCRWVLNLRPVGSI